MAATQAPLRTFQGHYAYSSLRPIATYVPRLKPQRKIKAQLHDFKYDRVEGVRIGQIAAHAPLHPRISRGVFWIEAGLRETIKRDYIQIYGLLYGQSTIASQETVS